MIILRELGAEQAHASSGRRSTHLSNSVTTILINFIVSDNKDDTLIVVMRQEEADAD